MLRSGRVDAIIEGDGYARQRYVGQAYKGPPTRAITVAQLLTLAGASCDRAREALTEAERLEPRLRKGAQHVAYGQVDLARRLLAELLAFVGFEVNDEPLPELTDEELAAYGDPPGAKSHPPTSRPRRRG